MEIRILFLACFLLLNDGKLFQGFLTICFLSTPHKICKSQLQSNVLCKRSMCISKLHLFTLIVETYDDVIVSCIVYHSKWFKFLFCCISLLVGRLVNILCVINQAENWKVCSPFSCMSRNWYLKDWGSIEFYSLVQRRWHQFERMWVVSFLVRWTRELLVLLENFHHPKFVLIIRQTTNWSFTIGSLKMNLIVVELQVSYKDWKFSYDFTLNLLKEKCLWNNIVNELDVSLTKSYYELFPTWL